MSAGVALPAEKPVVLVNTTTWWPTVAVLASSLERAGFDVVLLCPKGHVGHEALHLRCLTLDRGDPVAALARAIRAVGPTCVVPGDDRAVGHLIRLAREDEPELSALLTRSLGPASSHPALTERVTLLRAAEAVGMPVPAYGALPSRDHLDRWLAVAPAPWVMKADGAWGGEGVAITSGPDEARRAFRRLGRGPSRATAWWRVLVNGDPFWLHDRQEQPRRNLSWQAFVTGRPGTCALFARDGTVLGATTVEAETTSTANGPSTVLQAVDRPEFLDGARRLIGRLRLSGFIGLDFMVEDATGRAVLIEMNPRFTSASHMRGPFGLDPVRAAAEAYGCARPDTLPAPRDRFAAFPLAWLCDPFATDLNLCSDDCPWHEPHLMRASLETLWPERGTFAALPGRVRAWKTAFRRSDPGDYRDRPLSWWIENDLLRPPDILSPASPTVASGIQARHDRGRAAG